MDFMEHLDYVGRPFYLDDAMSVRSDVNSPVSQNHIASDIHADVETGDEDDTVSLHANGTTTIVCDGKEYSFDFYAEWYVDNDDADHPKLRWDASALDGHVCDEEGIPVTDEEWQKVMQILQPDGRESAFLHMINRSQNDTVTRLAVDLVPSLMQAAEEKWGKAASAKLEKQIMCQLFPPQLSYAEETEEALRKIQGRNGPDYVRFIGVFGETPLFRELAESKPRPGAEEAVEIINCMEQVAIDAGAVESLNETATRWALAPSEAARAQLRNTNQDVAQWQNQCSMESCLHAAAEKAGVQVANRRFAQLLASPKQKAIMAASRWTPDYLELQQAVLTGYGRDEVRSNLFVADGVDEKVAPVLEAAVKYHAPLGVIAQKSLSSEEAGRNPIDALRFQCCEQSLSQINAEVERCLGIKAAFVMKAEEFGRKAPSPANHLKAMELTSAVLENAPLGELSFHATPISKKKLARLPSGVQELVATAAETVQAEERQALQEVQRVEQKDEHAETVTRHR